MRRAMLGVAIIGVALTVCGSVFERFLSPDRPGDRAIMGYLDLVKSGRASSMDLANLGVLILEKGFPGDAEDYLLAALKLDKHNYEAAYRLGLVLQREGRDREAVRYYKKTIKERPGYAQALFMLALAEERSGQREEAIHHYAKAYRHAPELANPRKNPLVYDSNLQTEAVLRHYQEEMRTSTLKVTEIDPAAIRRMMEIKAHPAEGQKGTPEATVPTTPQQPGAPQGTYTQPTQASPRAMPLAPGVGATGYAPVMPAAVPTQGAGAVTPGTEGQPPRRILPGFGRSQPQPGSGRTTSPAQPGSAVPTPTPEPSSVEPTPTPEPSSDEPTPTPEPSSDEPKPTPTPTR